MSSTDEIRGLFRERDAARKERDEALKQIRQLQQHAAKTLATMLLKGKAGDLPITITIDPTVDS